MLPLIAQVVIDKALEGVSDKGKDIDVIPEKSKDIIDYINSKGFYCEEIGYCSEVNITVGMLWWKKTITHKASSCISVAPTKELFDNRERGR